MRVSQEMVDRIYLLEKKEKEGWIRVTVDCGIIAFDMMENEGFIEVRGALRLLSLFRAQLQSYIRPICIGMALFSFFFLVGDSDTNQINLMALGGYYLAILIMMLLKR